MARKPNANCVGCGKPYYRRPHHIKAGVHTQCMECYKKKVWIPEIACAKCGKMFKGSTRTQRYCSKRCAAKASRGPWSTKYAGAPRSVQERRRLLLEAKYEEAGYPIVCSVVGCSYGNTLFIHRVVPGKEGGKYEIGNMFFVCPNHHEEVHRDLIRLTPDGSFVLIAEDI